MNDTTINSTVYVAIQRPASPQLTATVRPSAINTTSSVIDVSSGLPTPISPDGSIPGLDKKYPCPSCDKAFSQLAHLKIHSRMHSGEKPFACAFEGCGKSFSQLGNLKTHERKHSGEKPYECSHPGCGKVFSQAGNRKTHELLHSGEKPYACVVEGCDKSFSQQGNLKVHESPIAEPRKRKNAKPAQPRKKRRVVSGDSTPEEQNIDVAIMESELFAKLKAVIDRSGSNEISPRRVEPVEEEVDDDVFDVESFDDISFAAALLSNM